MMRAVAFYFLGIASLALVITYSEGYTPTPARIAAGLAFALAAAFGLWLRWDWAVRKGREKRARDRAEKDVRP